MAKLNLVKTQIVWILMNNYKELHLVRGSISHMIHEDRRTLLYYS